MHFFRLVAIAISAFLIVTPAVGQDVLASIDGMKSFKRHQATQCSKNTPTLSVVFEAEKPESFFHFESLNSLLAATRIALNLECPGLMRFEIFGSSRGHLLDTLSVSEPEWAIARSKTFGTDHPIFGNLPRQRAGGLRSVSRLDGDHSQGNQTPKNYLEYNRFLYVPDRWFKLGAGGVQPNTRYTDMRESLVGKSYLLYEYHPKEMSSHLREDYDRVALEDRVAKIGFTVGADHVTLFTANDNEAVGYGTVKTKQDASVSCFRSALTGSDKCLTLLRTEASFFQPFFLAFVTPHKDHTGKIRYDFDTLGYLKETSEEIAQAELAVAKQLEEIAALQDQQDTKDGKPKQSLSLSGSVTPYMIETYNRIYSGNFDEKYQIPLEISYHDMSDSSRALIRELIFLAHHQVVGLSCPATSGERRKIFNFLDTSRLANTNNLLTSSALFVQSFGQPMEVREKYFDIYNTLANVHLLKVYWEYESSTIKDVSFRRALDLHYETYQYALSASAALVQSAGCGTPTMQKFEANLVSFAYRDDDADL